MVLNDFSFHSLSFCFALTIAMGQQINTPTIWIFGKISRKKGKHNRRKKHGNEEKKVSIDGGNIGGSFYSLFITQSTEKSVVHGGTNKIATRRPRAHHVCDEINSLFMISVCENGAFVTRGRVPTANRIRCFCHGNANGRKHGVQSFQWAQLQLDCIRLK